MSGRRLPGFERYTGSFMVDYDQVLYYLLLRALFGSSDLPKIGSFLRLVEGIGMSRAVPRYFSMIKLTGSGESQI